MKSELEAVIKKQKYFLKTVCPQCESKFCEPYFCKKHMEFEHGESAPFKCDFCETRFHSRQAQTHHQTVHHTENPPKETCKECGKVFSARVSLENHMKYFRD